MSQTRLVDLARLSIVSCVARQVDFDSVITNFAHKEARKALIKKINDFLSFFLEKILLRTCRSHIERAMCSPEK